METFWIFFLFFFMGLVLIVGVCLNKSPKVCGNSVLCVDVMYNEVMLICSEREVCMMGAGAVQLGCREKVVLLC